MKQKLPKIPESAIQSHIIQYMTMRNWFVMRLNSGMVENKYGGRIRLAPAGTPDLLLIKDGKILFIEVKSAIGKITPLQEEFAEKLRSYGAEVILSRGIDDLQERGY